MLFTKLGRFAAWIMLLLGSSRLIMGFLVAWQFDDVESRAAATRRYIGSGTSGEAIEQGFIVILIAIAVGILVEISSNLNR